MVSFWLLFCTAADICVINVMGIYHFLILTLCNDLDYSLISYNELVSYI